MEGILPQELLHIPRELMHSQGEVDRVVDVRYDFNENKRGELVATIKKARR